MFYIKPNLKNMSQGARLEYIREVRHMTKEDVAAYFGFGGKEPNKTIREYENNTTSPSPIKLGRKQALGVPKNIWSKKLVCECGSNFNRKIYHKNKDGTTYCYICYNKKTRPKNRFKDSCDMGQVPEWKLQYMAEAIFRNLTQNSDNRRELAERLYKGVDIDEHPEKKMLQRIDKLNQLIENETTKLDRLMDNYLDENIDINMYDMFQKKLSSRIEKYEIEILELEKKCSSIEPLEVRIENAKKSIRKLLDINYNGVDEKIIEEFVEKVIVHKGYFEWKLNFMNETIKLEVDGKSKKDGFLIEHKE